MFFVGNTTKSEVRLIDELLDAVLVAMQDKQMIMEHPPTMDLYPGRMVLVNPQLMSIVDTHDATTLAGDIVVVKSIPDQDSTDIGGTVEVEISGVTRRVLVSDECAMTIKEGHRVQLDPSASIIMRCFGAEDAGYQFNEHTNVTWADIAGLVEAKKQMQEAIELPYKSKALYEAYNKKPIKGILLYGPPGCGKTMLAKAAATAMQTLHQGAGAETGFIYIKGPEILDRFVGVAEATIRSIFQQAREHKAAHGYPAVVFIDEAESILGRRGTGISSDMEKTIVPMFLAEMDGLDDSAALFILATNRADILDPAIIRDGRIDRKIKITRPSQVECVDIFQLNLAKVPLANGTKCQSASEWSSRTLFEKALYNVKRDDGVHSPFTLGHLANGAMVTSIVDQATSCALHRDMASGQVTGVCEYDILHAIDAVYSQNYELDHGEDLRDFVAPFYTSVLEVTKVVR
jgi:proteasome-associated ATPase